MISVKFFPFAWESKKRSKTAPKPPRKTGFFHPRNRRRNTRKTGFFKKIEKNRKNRFFQKSQNSCEIGSTNARMARQTKWSGTRRRFNEPLIRENPVFAFFSVSTKSWKKPVSERFPRVGFRSKKPVFSGRFRSISGGFFGRFRVDFWPRNLPQNLLENFSRRTEIFFDVRNFFRARNFFPENFFGKFFLRENFLCAKFFPGNFFLREKFFRVREIFSGKFFSARNFFSRAWNFFSRRRRFFRNFFVAHDFFTISRFFQKNRFFVDVAIFSIFSVFFDFFDFFVKFRVEADFIFRAVFFGFETIKAF